MNLKKYCFLTVAMWTDDPDMDAYAEKYGSKTVRKNITIPAWLNTYGEKNHINFSKVLQDALLSSAAQASD